MILFLVILTLLGYIFFQSIFPKKKIKVKPASTSLKHEKLVEKLRGEKERLETDNLRLYSELERNKVEKVGFIKTIDSLSLVSTVSDEVQKQLRAQIIAIESGQGETLAGFADSNKGADYIVDFFSSLAQSTKQSNLSLHPNKEDADIRTKTRLSLANLSPKISLRPALLTQSTQMPAGDTLFGFNKTQTAYLASVVLARKYYKEALDTCEYGQLVRDLRIENQEELVKAQDEDIQHLRQITDNQRKIIEGKDKELASLAQEFARVDEKRIKYKRRARGKFFYKMATYSLTGLLGYAAYKQF